MRRIFFLFGIRGVGKSTWTRAQFPDAHAVDLLDETRYQALLADPGQLALEFGAAAVARNTVEGYVEILQDTLLATLLPAFEPRLRVRERRHPKLYWVDPGLVRAAKKQLGPVAEEEKGALLEGRLFTVLRARNEQAEILEDIGYWSPADARQTEVDFLLRRGKEYLAIEVKARSRFTPDQLSGLTAVAPLPKLARRILVYCGRQKLKTGTGIEVWPLRELFNALERKALAVNRSPFPQPPAGAFAQHARNQRLVRQPLFRRPQPNGVQIGLRDAQVHPLNALARRPRGASRCPLPGTKRSHSPTTGRAA